MSPGKSALATADTVSLEELPDGVVVADASGSVVAANAVAERMLGVPRGGLRGTQLRAAMGLDDLAGNRWFDCVQPYNGIALRSGIPEQRWHLPDGRELLVAARLVRSRRGGPVDKVVVTLRDARVRARHDREVSDLVATVAHELRSPLTGVKGFTATLLSKWHRFSDSQRLLMLQTVDADADRLSRLVTELLDAARIDSGRMQLRKEPVDLATVAERVVRNVSAGGGARPVLRVREPLPKLWGDSDRLAQVITNLVENAIRHGAGQVCVTLAASDDSERPAVQLLVDDEGAGVSADIRERVFTRFWHAPSSGGTGLGLYIVRGVVAAHGGSVGIEDAPGGGARVRVRLPCAEPDVLRG